MLTAARARELGRRIGQELRADRERDHRATQDGDVIRYGGFWPSRSVLMVPPALPERVRFKRKKRSAEGALGGPMLQAVTLPTR